MKNKLTLTALALTAGFVGSANADILVNETFSYTDGNLTDNAAWSTHSGTAGQTQVTSGQVTISDSSTEDSNITFTEATSGALFYSFDFSVADPGSYSGTDFEYFAHFKDDGSNFTSRLDLVNFTASGFGVGISGSSSTADSTWAASLSYATTYQVVVGYDFTSGISTLWVDPTTTSDTNITSAADIADDFSAFAFRQSSASPDQTITIDNLLVTTTFAEAVPEPSSYALIAGLLGLTSVMLRRRTA